MASRIYDRELKCGCLVSSDGGGGCMPCHYVIPDEPLTEEDEKQIALCTEAWEEWLASDDHKEYVKEVEYKNN